MEAIAMKLTFKKIISIALALMLTLSLSAPALTAAAESANYVPTVLIIGRTKDMKIYSPDGELLFPLGDSLDTSSIAKAVLHCIPYLGVGMLTGDYEPWVNEFYEAIAPYYENIICDENGNLSDKSVETKYDYTNPQKGNHNGCDYVFMYDWRLDPCDVADYLDTYIDNILEATKCEKVGLVGRCYGSSVLSAYLYEYGCEKVHSAVYYVSTSQGTSARASEIFAGKFDLDPVAIENIFQSDDFVNVYNDLIEDPVLRELVVATLSLLNSVEAMNIPLEKVTEFVKAVYPELAPKVVPATYGTFASIWATVTDEDYEQAKALVFKGQEDKYAGLIEKIDHYHYDIQANTVSMLEELRSQGMRLGVVVKYDTPTYLPFTPGARLNGDDTVEVVKASFGATAANYGETLTAEQMANTDPEYISSDHIINAVTCAFPECTWFIKDCIHSNFVGCIDELNVTILRSEEQMTVDSDPRYPRFMKYDSQTKTISPLTDEPTDNSQKGTKQDIFTKLFNFIKLIIQAIVNLFRG